MGNCGNDAGGLMGMHIHQRQQLEVTTSDKTKATWDAFNKLNK